MDSKIERGSSPDHTPEQQTALRGVIISVSRSNSKDVALLFLLAVSVKRGKAGHPLPATTDFTSPAPGCRYSVSRFHAFHGARL